MTSYSEIEGVSHWLENLSREEIAYLRKMIERDKTKQAENKLHKKKK